MKWGSWPVVKLPVMVLAVNVLVSGRLTLVRALRKKLGPDRTREKPSAPYLGAEFRAKTLLEMVEVVLASEFSIQK